MKYANIINTIEKYKERKLSEAETNVIFFLCHADKISHAQLHKEVDDYLKITKTEYRTLIEKQIQKAQENIKNGGETQ